MKQENKTKNKTQEWFEQQRETVIYMCCSGTFNINSMVLTNVVQVSSFEHTCWYWYWIFSEIFLSAWYLYLVFFFNFHTSPLLVLGSKADFWLV
jgi:hypothetical protein